MRTVILLSAYGYLVYRFVRWGAEEFGWLAGIGVAALAVGLVFVVWRRTMGGMSKGLEKRQQADQAKQAGNFEKAEILLLAGIEETRESTNKGSRGVLHWDLAELYTELERWDEAIDHFKAALDLTHGDNSPHGVQIQAVGPTRLLQLYADHQRWEDYEDYAIRLIAQAEPQTAASLRLELAGVLLQMGKLNDAIDQAELAARSFALRADTEPGQYLGSLLQLSAITWQAQDGPRALNAASRLLSASEALPDEDERKAYWQTLALTAKAQAELLQHHNDAALALARDAVPVATASGDSELYAHSMFVLAKVLQCTGNIDPARSSAQQALSLWESSEHTVNAEKARALLAELDQPAPEPGDSDPHLTTPAADHA